VGVDLGGCKLSSSAIIILAPDVNSILQPACTLSYTVLMVNVIRFVRKVVENNLAAKEIFSALSQNIWDSEFM
jgi:hypothetical protein